MDRRSITPETRPSEGRPNARPAAASRDGREETAQTAALRERARRDVEDGPITSAYGCDKDQVIRRLNDALATELVCVLRYRRHYYTAKGAKGETVAQEFLEHANEEMGHADRLAERITQLGGDPDLDPSTLAKRSHSQYVAGSTLADMVREDLVAERIAIESYSEFIRYVADGDPTTRRLLEEILANEEEHANDMRDLLGDLGRTS